MQECMESWDDLRFFLEDKPIQAKRPTVAERARKWLRRHPAFQIRPHVVLAHPLAGAVDSHAAGSDRRIQAVGQLHAHADRVIALRG